MNTAVITEVKPASPGQLFEIGSSISTAVGKLLAERNITFDQAAALLHEEGKVVISRISCEVVEKFFALAPADPLVKYKKDLEKFFLKVYDLKLDLSSMNFPVKEGFGHFMVKPAGLGADAIFAAFGKIDLPSWKYMDGSIVKKKKSEQERPTETYVFAHKGGAEPDAEHLGKSYDDFIAEGAVYLTIDEYMLIEQFMWLKFKIHLDVKGWTRTTTLDSDGCVMFGRWYAGGCELSWLNRGGRDAGGGPRSAVLL